MPRFLLSLLLSILCIDAYVPSMNMLSTGKPKVQVPRREALMSGVAFLSTVVLTPKPSFAGSLEINNPIPDDEYVPSQQVKGDKVDVNSAFVGDYKQFPGMFPHAAGMIASHGPYQDVRDIYKIEGLTENDRNMFRKYDKFLTALPVTRRAFNERINARVST